MAKTLMSMLTVRPEEINSPEKRKAYTISVAGCNLQGLLYGIAFAEAGFKVNCIDLNHSTIKLLSNGKTMFFSRDIETKFKKMVKTGKLIPTSALKDSINKSNIVIIATHPKIVDKKTFNYSEIQKTCKNVGKALQKGSLVLFVGLSSFGLMDALVKETIENTSGYTTGEQIGLAYIPPQINAGQEIKIVGQYEIIIAAKDKLSLNSAALLLETIAKRGVKKLFDFKLAELTALFKSTIVETNRALANEFAIFCERVGVDYFEMLKATESTELLDFLPTVKNDKHNDEMHLLLETAESYNSKLKLPNVVHQINSGMVKHTINLTHTALRKAGKTLRRAKIGIIGSLDSRSSLELFVEQIESKGSRVSIYDPQNISTEREEVKHLLKKTLIETVEGADCIILWNLSPSFNFNVKKVRNLMKSPAVLIDMVGIMEQKKIQGFIYQGLGRGVLKR